MILYRAINPRITVQKWESIPLAEAVIHRWCLAWLISPCLTTDDNECYNGLNVACRWNVAGKF